MTSYVVNVHANPVLLLTLAFYDITAETLVHSLANFHCQKVQMHEIMIYSMCQQAKAVNLTILFVITKKKLMSIFHESLLLLTMNFLIIYFDNVTRILMIKNRTDT